MKIITDNKPRLAVCWHRLPEKAQTDFDYIRPEQSYESRFVRYKGEWYDATDAQGITTKPRGNLMGWDMRVEVGSQLAKWHAIITESFFSGTLFRFIAGEDHVVVGRYTT